MKNLEAKKHPKQETTSSILLYVLQWHHIAFIKVYGINELVLAVACSK